MAKESDSYLIFSEDRLCPVKGMTIPRLESIALLTEVRLTKCIIKHLKLPFSGINVWSNFKCAFSWVKSNKLLPTFINNRAKEIRDCKDFNLTYVSTSDNPADIAMRQSAINDFKNNKLWWNGPHWLPLNQSEWPNQQYLDIEVENSKENLLILNNLELKSNEPNGDDLFS